MNQPRRTGLIEPGEDPLQLVRQARGRRGLGGLFGGALSLSTLFYIGAALAFAYYLWWQFGPKPQVAAAQGPAPTATASPSPSPTATASPTSSPLAPTPTATSPARPTSPVPTQRAEVTRLVPATVMVEVTRLVSAGGGGTRVVEVTRLVPSTVEVVVSEEPAPTSSPVVVIVEVVVTATLEPSPTLEPATPDPRLTEVTYLPFILR